MSELVQSVDASEAALGATVPPKAKALPPTESISGLSRTQKDLLAGTVGGIAQVLVGQPFDICKTRLQCSPPGTYTSALDCASQLLRREGPLAFYKGTTAPLVGIGACVSIQFAALEAAKRYFAGRKGKGKELGTGELFASGAFAGVCNTVVSGPVEHVRIRLQTQPSGTPLYAGPIDCVRKLYAANGIAGVFKGQLATVWRDGVGYGSYFAAYEFLVQAHCKRNNVTRSEIAPGWAVTYGACAGYALWASIYPVDVIKSKLQTDAVNPAGRAYTGMIDCARKTWQTQGLKGFTNGLGPTLVRSPFANGATFLFFEMTMRALG